MRQNDKYPQEQLDHIFCGMPKILNCKLHQRHCTFLSLSLVNSQNVLQEIENARKTKLTLTLSECTVS